MSQDAVHDILMEHYPEGRTVSQIRGEYSNTISIDRDLRRLLKNERVEKNTDGPLNVWTAIPDVIERKECKYGCTIRYAGEMN